MGYQFSFLPTKIDLLLKALGIHRQAENWAILKIYHTFDFPWNTTHKEELKIWVLNFSFFFFNFFFSLQPTKQVEEEIPYTEKVNQMNKHKCNWLISCELTQIQKLCLHIDIYIYNTKSEIQHVHCKLTQEKRKTNKVQFRKFTRLITK